jgi:putative ATP-dependent endonuclease of OLD family
MKINKLHISNYRNIHEQEIFFHEDANFIIGENNIGKSNLIKLINIICNGMSFDEADFLDISQPIKVELQLKLDEIEQHAFDQNIDASNTRQITICATQEIDERITFECVETQVKLNYSQIRNTNFIFYDSLRNPITELDFSKKRGTGKFLNYLVKKYLKDQNNNATSVLEKYLQTSELDKVILEINTILQKIVPFKELGIDAKLENEVEELISRIISLKDNKNRYFYQAGYGIQFLATITISILEKILTIIERKGEDAVFTSEENNKRYISLIVALDEPEIHLHPYLQRSLIKFLLRIVNNQDRDFSELIKVLFDIDGVIGQVIVVSHSPNIILNDYKQIIRFSLKNDFPAIISGSSPQLRMDSDDEKHLLRNFLNLKEAFFAKKAIIIEGDTEFGAVPEFCKKLNIDVDDHGIAIIKSDGKESMPKIETLLNKFGLQCVTIKDRDSENTTLEDDIHYITTYRDLEQDITELIIEDDTIINQIITFKSNEHYIQKSALEYKSNLRYGYINQGEIKKNDLKFSECENENQKKQWIITYLVTQKNIAFGRFLGELLPSEYIPESYIKALEKIRTL